MKFHWRNFFGQYFPALLGLLLLYSGFYKVLHPGEATYALMALGAKSWLANTSVMLTTATELYLGLILLLRLDLRFGLIATTVLMSAFTVFLWYLSTLAHPPSCGCMGLTGIFGSTKKAAIFGLARNCLLLWGLKYSYEYYFRSTAQGAGALLKARGAQEDPTSTTEACP